MHIFFESEQQQQQQQQQQQRSQDSRGRECRGSGQSLEKGCSRGEAVLGGGHPAAEVALLARWRCDDGLAHAGRKVPDDVKGGVVGADTVFPRPHAQVHLHVPPPEQRAPQDLAPVPA